MSSRTGREAVQPRSSARAHTQRRTHSRSLDNDQHLEQHKAESRELRVEQPVFLAPERGARGRHGAHRANGGPSAAAPAHGAHQLRHRSDPQQRGAELHAGLEDARDGLRTLGLRRRRERRLHVRKHRI